MNTGLDVKPQIREGMEKELREKNDTRLSRTQTRDPLITTLNQLNGQAGTHPVS